MLKKTHPDRVKFLMELAQDDVNQRWKMYEQLSKEYEPQKPGGDGEKKPTTTPAALN